MTTLIAEPQLVDGAAANVAEIKSAIGAAKAAAAGPTTGLAAAAQMRCQRPPHIVWCICPGLSVGPDAGRAFDEEFAAALASAGNAYAAAEAANASAISGRYPH